MYASAAESQLLNFLGNRNARSGKGGIKVARLTKRTENGVAYMAIADALPKRQQEIEGSKPILEALYAMFQKLAYYEDKEEQEAAGKTPDECYKEYGSDLDGCSTQSNEGCGRCSIFRGGRAELKRDSHYYINELKDIINAIKQGSHVFNGMMHQSRVIALAEHCLMVMEKLETEIKNNEGVRAGVDVWKTALVIGKTKSDAENMVKNLGLVGYREILTRGVGSLKFLDGIRAERVYIYADCGDYAKNYAEALANVIEGGEVFIIKRATENEGEQEYEWLFY